MTAHCSMQNDQFNQKWIELLERCACVNRPKDWVMNPVIEIPCVKEFQESKQLVNKRIFTLNKNKTYYNFRVVNSLPS